MIIFNYSLQFNLVIEESNSIRSSMDQWLYVVLTFSNSELIFYRRNVRLPLLVQIFNPEDDV